MRRYFFCITGVIIFSSVCIFAQLPPSPIPIIEADRANNSIRIRSAELERIKREAGKPTFESDSERQIRFAKVKGNFEKIQKLQDTIVRLYTRSKKIDYLKISETATQLVKNAIHLEENLFGENFANIEKKEISKKSKAKNIPDLIVALDNAIGLFVVSPIFQNRQTVDSEESEKAEETLREIIRLSGELSKESAKLK